MSQQPKRKNKMIRLNPKSKPTPKGQYMDVDEANFLINNDLPINYKNGRKQFNKNNNGKKVK